MIDVLRAIQHCINNKEISGPVNFTAPHPVTARCFASQLKKVTKAKIVLPIPRMLVRLIFSEGVIVLTNSHKVLPTKLTGAGFQFSYENLKKALDYEYSRQFDK